MKNAKKPHERRALKILFFRNYIVISGLLIGTLTLSMFASDFLMNRVVDKTIDASKVDVSKIYAYPFENIDPGLLQSYGGWFEILDESGRVIFVKGTKEDTIDHYTDEQFYQKIQRNDDSTAYHVYSVRGPNGERYALLWKIPRHSGRNLSIFVGIFFALFALFLLIAVYVYSLYSVKQVKKPLKQIVEGIREMERLHYQTRLDYSAEKEFAEIRDAFNEMAERLQRTAAEKEIIEKNKRNMLLHLSHDLKTPITSIYGYSQLLADDQLVAEDQKNKYIRYIHDKSFYMTNLVKDLFELAKLDDHQLKLNREPVNIAEWLRQIIVEFYPEIEGKGFELEADIPEERWIVPLDSIQLKRVITNILGNTLKYNPPGTSLYVSCAREQGQVVICIGDDGVGVEEEIKAHIFDEFVKGIGQSDGTGLGLAICKKIVTLHHGSIELSEDARYPTLFKIYLPSTAEVVQAVNERRILELLKKP
ncbi:ATP-binding protein [Paenibacillus elgii]